MLVVALITMYMLYRSVKEDYRRYKQTRSASIVIGWTLFGLTAIFFIVGVIVTINYGRVAPFNI